ncbi:hypothetical protein V6N12_035227 [Hibiscus sabdariffa]|uniref:Uncharacterized protein n=1 Tax=Hibiscus sabdariffa TaxID=183260 RepID=A0ABR2AY47_9ROSI
MIQQYSKRWKYDILDSSRNVFGNSSQTGFNSRIEDHPYRSRNSFIAILESGKSSAFYPYGGPSTYARSYRSMIIQFPKSTIDLTIDIENLRSRRGEKFANSSEDEDTRDPDLTGDDIGNDLIFGGGEFVSVWNEITWYEPPAHMNLIDYDVMRAPKFPNMPQLSLGPYDKLLVVIQLNEKNEATLATKKYSFKKHVDFVVKKSSPQTLFCKMY